MVQTIRHGQVKSRVKTPGVSSGSAVTPVVGTRRSSTKNDDKNKKNAAPPPTLSPEAGYPCNVCRQNVGEVDALQCDNCQSWAHLGCTSLSLTQYNFLHDYPSSNFKWFCHRCDALVPFKASVSDSGQEARFDAQDTKIDSLTEVIKDISNTNKLILQLLQKDQSIESKIKTHVDQAFSDNRERDEKMNNVIVFNIPECADESDDVSIICEVLSHTCPEAKFDDLEAARISRIGKKKEGESQRPRPIKVKLHNTEDRNRLVKNSKNLKSYTRYERVGLSKDKTYAQIVKERGLRATRDLWIKEGKDAVIYDDMVMLRDEMERRQAERRDPNQETGTKSPTGDGASAKPRV